MLMPASSSFTRSRTLRSCLLARENQDVGCSIQTLDFFRCHASILRSPYAGRLGTMLFHKWPR